MYRNSKDYAGYYRSSSLWRWDVALRGWLVRMSASVSNKFSVKLVVCGGVRALSEVALASGFILAQAIIRNFLWLFLLFLSYIHIHLELKGVTASKA